MRRLFLAIALCIAPAATPVAPLHAQDGATAEELDAELTYHRAPRPLPAGATTEDSPGFLGPRRDGHSRETHLRHDFGEAGPPLVWERDRGQGYAAPALAEGILALTHSQGDQLHVDAIDAATGKRLWRQTRSFDYEPRFIRNPGPRATPQIHGERLYVLGVDNTLCAYGLKDGELAWQRDLRSELGARDDFFGGVASPLPVGDTLILNIGAEGGPSIVALAMEDGALRWEAEEEWGASCASPVLATIGGQEQLLLMAGGESRPPVGGLLVLDPKTGKERYRYPFRSRTALSVLGSSPLVTGNRILMTAGYNTGTASVELSSEGVWSEAWTRREPGCEFQNPVFAGGLVHLIDGTAGQVAAVVALDPASGEQVARTTLTWKETLRLSGGEPKQRSQSMGQASLLYADGALLMLGDYGHLLWVKSTAKGATIEARAKLFFAGETWSPPVIHRGLLYVCQNTRDRETGQGPRLLCFDLRGE